MEFKIMSKDHEGKCKAILLYGFSFSKANKNTV